MGIMVFALLVVSLSVKIYRAAFAATLLLSLSCSVEGRSGGRRRLKPSESIAEHIKNEIAQGNKKPKFTISAEDMGPAVGEIGKDESNDKGKGNGKDKGKDKDEEIDFHVVLPEQAVTPDTIVYDEKGIGQRVGDLGYAILVSDDPDTLALVSVDLRSDAVQGVVDKKGKKMKKLKQGKGQASMLEDEEEFEPPPFSCDAEHLDEKWEEESSPRQHLFEHRSLQDHDYRHASDNKHNPDSRHDPDNKNSHVVISNDNNRRRLSSSYSYQVDVHIDIDTELVSRLGSVTNVVQYVNLLITGANTYYESEIDTHLHVAGVQFSTRYDGASGSSNALKIIRDHWRSVGWAPEVDLVFGLFGKKLGGGLAYGPQVCNSSWGYGVAGGIRGRFSDINASTVWDLLVFSHELGHIFGAPHTHSLSPQVDHCRDSCHNPAPTTKSATLMSYCYICSGSYKNVLYTYGGSYSGTGDPNDLDHWHNNPNLVGSFSHDPRRIPHIMWSHVSTRGSCVEIALPPTKQPTKPPTSEPTKQPTKPPTNEPTKQPTKSPTNKPTVKPTKSPTNQPTGVSPPPTRPPTVKPTNKPTNIPTKQPTNEPTKTPTLKPTSLTPPSIATFDPSTNVPSCLQVVSTCDSSALVNGRAGLGPEPQQPNSLDGCQDGTIGTHHEDESIDRIVVRSTDGENFRGGAEIVIEATVFAWGSGSWDFAHFFHAADVMAPSWNYVDSLKPPSGGLQVLSARHVLPEGFPMQAVRVVFEYSTSGGTAIPCPGGSWTDVDDIVIAVDTTLPNIATYNSELGAPWCNTLGTAICDSSTLLLGRAELGPEPNHPNTIDGCQDGTSGTFHSDESIDRLVVETLDGSPIRAGATIVVKATVFPWDVGQADVAHFYYAANANDPQWVKFATVEPTGGGSQTLQARYVLPSGHLQAVRVNFLYELDDFGGDPCQFSLWGDRDDLVFIVEP